MKPKNHLLAAMPRNLYEKLHSSLQEVWLPQGKILHHPGEEIQHLYFPISCVVSITTTMQDGSTAETGIVGNREVVGVNAFMGGSETTQTEYVVQIAGSAMMMKAQILRDEFECNQELRHVLLCYTQALIAQISQTTACNRLHSLEQRLGRWLLEAYDRIESNEIILTQEFIADMLGVRRAGVTQAAQKLQERGFIKYQRGHIYVLDVKGLKSQGYFILKMALRVSRPNWQRRWA